MNRRPTMAILLVLLTAAACTRPDGTDHTDMLVWRLPGEPKSLDPARADESRAQSVVRRTHEGLVALDPTTGEVVPALAGSWEVTANGLLYTFQLRPGVTFHDGQELRAEDAVFSLDRHLDPAVGSALMPYLTDVLGARARADGAAPATAGIRAAGDLSVEIELVQPYRPLLFVLSMAQAAIVPAGAHPGSAGQIQGTGPFAFEAWERGRYLDLRAFQDHRNGKPELGGVRMLFVSDGVTALEQFLAGEIDILDGLPAGRRASFAAAHPGMLRTARPMTLYGLGINHARQPLGSSAMLRRAIAHAVDREFLCRELNEGRDQPAHQILPPGLRGHDPNLPRFGFDLKESARLLRAAGYPGGRGLAPLRVAYPAADSATRRNLERLQGDLKTIGVVLELRPMDFATYVERIEQGAQGMQPYDLYRVNWVADFPEPSGLITPLLHSSAIGHGGGNVSYRDETLDQLLDQARSERRPDHRAALYRSASRRVHETVAFIPIYRRGDDVVVQPWVQGLEVGMLPDSAIALERVTLSARSSP